MARRCPHSQARGALCRARPQLSSTPCCPRCSHLKKTGDWSSPTGTGERAALRSVWAPRTACLRWPRVLCATRGRHLLGAPRGLGGQGDPSVDLLRHPIGDVRERPVQRPADERGVGPVAGAGPGWVVVVVAADLAAQQLFIGVSGGSLPVLRPAAGRGAVSCVSHRHLRRLRREPGPPGTPDVAHPRRPRGPGPRAARHRHGRLPRHRRPPRGHAGPTDLPGHGDDDDGSRIGRSDPDPRGAGQARGTTVGRARYPPWLPVRTSRHRLVSCLVTEDLRGGQSRSTFSETQARIGSALVRLERVA